MSQLYTITLHSLDSKAPVQNLGVASGGGARGGALRVQLPPSARVELIEDASRTGPKKIQIKRVGKDLHVAFEGSDVAQPDVILENYYREDGSQRLVGRDAGGALHEYVPQSSQGGEYVGSLGEAQPSRQVMDTRIAAADWGTSAGAGAGAGAAGFAPWTLALGALGIGAVAAAAGGGGDGSPATAAAVTPPSVQLDASSNSGNANDTVTRDTAPKLGGSGTPGATIEVILAGQTYRTTVAADGTWSVTPSTALPDGTYQAQVRQINAQGVSSEPTNVSLTIDTSLPTVTPPASVVSNDTTPTIAGTGTAGDTVTVVVNGQTLTTTVAANGTWSVTPTTALPAGSYVAAVTVSDPAGNSTSANVPLTIDTTAPTFTPPVSVVSNDTTPTIAGIGTAGDTVSVVVNGQTLTTTVGANGTWSVTPTTALPAGSYVAAVTVTDPAGNPTSANVPVTINTSAPSFTPPVSVVSNDTTPTIAGTGTAGDTVSVEINGQTLTTTVAADGTWSVTPAAALPAGPYLATVTVTNPAGSSATSSVPVTIDTTAPTFTPPASVVSNDTTPTIAGTGTAGDTVSVVVNGETLTTTVQPNGTWSVTPTTALPAGLSTAAVTVTDPAGNSTDAIVPITIDTTAPTFTPPASVVSNDTTPTIAGTGTAGDTVSVEVNGETLTTTVTADGTWSVTPTTGLPEGSYVAAVTVTNPAGSSATTGVPVTIDTNAPTFTPPVSVVSNDTTPTIAGTGTAGDTVGVVVNGQTLTTTVAADGTWSVTPTAALPIGSYVADVTVTNPAGGSATTGVTVTIDTTAPTFAPPASVVSNDTTPTIAGTGTAGDTVSVVVNGETLTTTVLPNGAWSVTPTTALPEGLSTAAITVTDPAGNSNSNTVPITIDTSAPTFTPPTSVVSNDTTPTIAGTGTAGDTVSVVLNGETLTTTVQPNGTWSVTPMTALPAGSYAAAVTVTNPAGSSATSSVPVTIDTTAPNFTPPVSVVSNDTTPTIAGSGTAGDAVSVVVNGETLTTTVQPNGTWSVMPTTALTEGSYTAAVTVTDPAGNTASSNVPVTVDTTAPSSPTISSLTSADTTPVITGTTGTGAALNSGETISVQVNGATYNVVPNASGNWSLDVATATPSAGALGAFVDGQAYPITATVTDQAGNVSTLSQALTIVLDTVAPVAVADTATMTEDAATVTGSVLANDTSKDGSETAALVGSGIGTYGTIALAADGSYTYTRNSTNVNNITTAVTDTFNYAATDAAGNTSSSSVTVSITPVNDAPVLASASITSNAALFPTASPRVVGTVSAYGTSSVAGVTVDATGQLGAGAFDIGFGPVFYLSDTVSGSAPDETLTLNFSGGASVDYVRVTWSGQQNTTQAAEEVFFTLNGTPVTPMAANFSSTTIGNTNSPSIIVGNRFVATLGQEMAGGAYVITSGTPITNFQITSDNVLGGATGIFARVEIGSRTYSNGAGVAISSLMPAVTDADASSSVRGYAITSAAAEGATDATPGQWQYFNGTAWVNLDSASTTSAVFLTASTLVRWSDDDITHTALTAIAVDNTSTAVLGAVLNVTATGNGTPYSATAATLPAGLGPVSIDLNGDGRIGYSQLEMDVNSDGVLDTTAWVGAQDGVLVWDRYQDGQVHDASQYAFTGGVTDLEGLAVRFDTNLDGVFNASDAAYADFAVWQDANQNGVSDSGEVISLEQLGITSIQLQSDGVQSAPADGVAVQGSASASTADGRTLLIHDVLFSYVEAEQQVVEPTNDVAIMPMDAAAALLRDLTQAHEHMVA
jgi:VCBS repeat-containing protein